jgi:hypothetical protein
LPHDPGASHNDDDQKLPSKIDSIRVSGASRVNEKVIDASGACRFDEAFELGLRLTVR